MGSGRSGARVATWTAVSVVVALEAAWLSRAFRRHQAPVAGEETPVAAPDAGFDARAVALKEEDAAPSGALAPLADPCGALGPYAPPHLDALLGAGFENDSIPTLVPLGQQCRVTRNGAWAVRLTRVDPDPDAGANAFGSTVTLHWDVLHVDARTGVVRRSETSRASIFDHDAQGESAVSDLDGDGEEELVVPSKRGGDENPYREAGGIWTFKDGHVKRYAPGLTFSRVEDVDSDGRVDLVTTAPYQVDVDRGCLVVEESATGPPLLLHTLPDGGFSTGDGVAKDFALRRCPEPPAHLVLTPDGGLEGDFEPAFERIACARLWGKPDSEIREQVAAECKVNRALDEGRAQPQDPALGVGFLCNAPHQTTELCDGGVPWGEVKPPLRLVRR
jgi:hypothetical protein